MSGSFFEELNIPTPNYSLNIGSGSHGKQTGGIMLGLEPIIKKETPDLTLVYGDTNTTMAAAIVSSKSASSSPGKPTITSEDNDTSGIIFLIISIFDRYFF